MALRLFVAINLDAAVRRSIVSGVQPLRSLVEGGRWVEEELLHVTVKFLGESDDRLVSSLSSALDAAVAGFRPMRIRIEGVGVFPNVRRPAVLYFGVRSDPKLELLYHEVEERCHVLGYALDGRAFRPHVTVARLRGPGVVFSGGFGGVASAMDLHLETEVTALDLMHSGQVNGRVRYTRLHSAFLNE